MYLRAERIEIGTNNLQDLKSASSHRVNARENSFGQRQSSVMQRINVSITQRGAANPQTASAVVLQVKRQSQQQSLCSRTSAEPGGGYCTGFEFQQAYRAADRYHSNPWFRGWKNYRFMQGLGARPVAMGDNESLSVLGLGDICIFCCLQASVRDDARHPETVQR